MSKRVGLAFLTMALAATAGYAAVFVPVYTETWTADVDDWWNNIIGEQYSTGPTWDDDLDGQPGVITMPADTTGDFDMHTDYLSSPANPWLTDNFGGQDMSTTAGQTTFLAFDFYALDYAPLFNSLKLYFYSETGSQYWFYDVTDLSPNTWQTTTIGMLQDAGWYGGSDFAAALADVDEIGWQLTYRANADQLWAFDNLSRGYMGAGAYAVPEPGSCAALGFAFLSLGVTFRRKLNEVMGRLTTRPGVAPNRHAHACPNRA